MIKKISVLTGFFLIFFLALGMRLPAFWTPHWQAQESRYISLAMKYSALGLDALNLDRVETRTSAFAVFPGWEFGVVSLAKAPDTGSAHDPLDVRAPLFPVLLAASHRWLALPGQPFLAVQAGPEKAGWRMLFKKYFFRTQGWAVAVPFLSGLLTVVLSFFFARYVLGTPAAFCAMIFSAVYPAWVTASCRISPEMTGVFLTVAAFYIFYVSCEKKNGLLAFISGITAGLAILAGQHPALAALPPALYLFLKKERSWLSFFWFLCGLIFISAHWFLRVYKVYGDLRVNG